MSDLTSQISVTLAERHSLRPIPKHAAGLHRKLDSFLSEAYQINQSISSLLRYLRAIRQPYLSTAPPPRKNHAKSAGRQSQFIPGFGLVPSYVTDQQREDIDSETSLLLNDINRNITNLASAAKLQNDTANKILEKQYGKPSGFLSRWAGGDTQDEDQDTGKSTRQLQEEGRARSLYGFREGVLWYLNYNLREAVGVQQSMVEVRLEREREKRESVLWDSRNKGLNVQQAEMMKKLGLEDIDGSKGPVNGDMRAKDSYNPALDDEIARGSDLGGLSKEQLQLFEEENNTLLNHYTDTLAKVTQAEKSLVEISSLQQTLVGHLTTQGEMINQLVEDASRTDENVQKGNKELKKASERGSVARGVFFGTVGLCSFLVVWDLIF